MTIYKVIDSMEFPIGIFFMRDDAEKCSKTHYKSKVVDVKVDIDFFATILTL